MNRTIQAKVRRVCAALVALVFGIWLARFIVIRDWEDSCERIYDPKLAALIAGKNDDEYFRLQEWFKRNYGWFAEDFEIHDYDPELRARWRIQYTHYYLTRISRNQWRATTSLRYVYPTLNDVLRCLGEPSHYEAGSVDNGSGERIFFVMWYPAKGYNAPKECFVADRESAVALAPLLTSDQAFVVTFHHRSVVGLRHAQ